MLWLGAAHLFLLSLCLAKSRSFAPLLPNRFAVQASLVSFLDKRLIVELVDGKVIEGTLLYVLVPIPISPRPSFKPLP